MRARRDRVRQFQVQEGRRRHGQHRGDPEAEPRVDRLRLGQDPAEDAGQHQRRHDGPGHRPRGQRRRSRRPRGSSCSRSIRATCGRASRAARPRCRRRPRRPQQLRLVARNAQGWRSSRREDNYNRQQELWKGGLTHARSARARRERPQDAAGQPPRRRSRTSRRRSCAIAQERASLSSAKYDLSRVRIESPINGIVTRRNIEEGETAVTGTMNNPGTVLLTIADMSVIEAEVEVDETDIPTVQLGQTAKVTIDAMPGKTFTAKVTEIGNSPIQAAGQAASAQATNFKVVLTLDGEIPEVRPGLHLHGRDHDRDAQERGRGADPGDDRPRDGRRRQGRDRPRAGRRPASAPPAGDAPAGGAQAGPVAQGARRRVPRARQQGPVRAGQDRHRRREVFRGPVRAQGRRPGRRRARSARCASCATARR